MATTRAENDPAATGNSDNEEDSSRRVRARVSRACARCRSRKDKCDGLQPQCSNCAGVGHACLYLPTNKKRGLPEGYVRGMEKLWAVMAQKVHGLDEVVQKVVVDNQEELLHVWNHHKHGDELHTAWKESKILAELEKLLSRLDQNPSNDLKRKRDNGDNGETTNALNGSSNELYQLTTEYQITGLHPFASPHASNIPSLESAGIEKAALLPSIAPNLVDHYFTYTHCWFPILDRPYTLKKFYECTRSHNPVRPSLDDLAFLWAICAYSKQQTSQLTAASPSSGELGADVHEMRSMARSLIPTETETLELGHVQALLLLVLLDMGTSKWTSAWILSGLAVRILLDKIDSLDNPARNWLATLQGCFMLDTLIAVRLERPPHLRNDLFKRMNLLDEDGHDEWQPWHAAGKDATQSREPAFIISCFNRMTDLCMILNATCISDSSFISGNEALIQVHQVADKFAFPFMTIERRPPHQMLLQALYFATLVKISHLTNEPQAIPRWRFLETLELFENTWNLPAQCGIPSLMVGLCYLVSSKIDVLEKGSNAQTPASFCQRLSGIMSKLSITWPDFKSASNVYLFSQRVMFNEGDRDQPGMTQRLALQVQPQSFSNQVLQPAHTNLWVTQAPVFGNEPDNGTIGTIMSGAHTTNHGQHASFSDTLRANQTIPIDYGAMSIDVPQQSGQTSVGPALSQRASSIGGMATSPSFNGDEIDALFHEMAELDTTQWTHDRSQALKDFGFSDDTTFEAFCNDPDRLMLSDAYMGPAFSQKNAGVGNQNLFAGSSSAEGLGSSGYGHSFDLESLNTSW